jgi:hypothetical protein
MKKSEENVLTNSAHTQLQVVVVAVYLLGGGSKSIDTEDVAIKCQEISPGLFSWKKYPQQINLELVRVVLSNAKKTQAGVLLLGSGREGWRLTPAGINWVNSEGKALLKSKQFPPNLRKRTAGSIDAMRLRRERERILTSNAWSHWTTDVGIDVKACEELFRVDDYTTPKMLKVKVSRLLDLFSSDPEVMTFLNDAASVINLKERSDAKKS